MGDLTISHRGMKHTVATVITKAVSSMVGWLENGLDFHVPKDEEGVERGGGEGGKSVVLVSNAPPRAALASSTKGLGMRVVSMRASWASTLTEQGRRGSAERNTDG